MILLWLMCRATGKDVVELQSVDRQFAEQIRRKSGQIARNLLLININFFLLRDYVKIIFNSCIIIVPFDCAKSNGLCPTEQSRGMIMLHVFFVYPLRGKNVRPPLPDT